MASSSDKQVLEGFLCPLCETKTDYRSAARLISHFESQHQEDQVLKSLKGIFGKALKIITNEESDFEDTFNRVVSQERYHEEQLLGLFRSSSDYFKAVRSSRVERYAIETNKLLIRLDKLLTNMPSDQLQRKQHEMHIVPWLDGAAVTRCPNCAKPFNLARRKHHCRLCGSILCHDCSIFLDIDIAKSIVDPSKPPPSQVAPENLEKQGLRLCEHCYNLIDLRKQVQDGSNSKTTLAAAYEQMRGLMEEAKPAVAMYEKMCESLFEGEMTYTLSDLNGLRGRVGKLAERIDALSKHIAALPADPGTRAHKLHAAIRQAATYYIKEELLSMRKLPTEAQIEEVRKRRQEERVRQIQEERDMWDGVKEESPRPSGSTSNDNIDDHDENDPLLEQINNVRRFLEDARKGGRYEEIAPLEANLKDLKKEYQLRKLSRRS